MVDLFDKFNASDYDQIIEVLENIYDCTGSRRAIGAKGLLQKVDKKEGGGFLSTTFRSFDYILSNVWASFFSEDGFDDSDDESQLEIPIIGGGIRREPAEIRI
jgi:hypothetical protein